MTTPERYYSRPRVGLRQLRQLAFPRRCPFCRRVLGNTPGCPACKEELDQVQRRPSRRLEPADHYFGALEGAAAPFFYQGVVRDAVLRAKYGGEGWTAVQLGCWMARLVFGAEITLRHGVELPGRVKGYSLQYDLVVPVPSSRRGRGYNVPSLMALPLAHVLGLPLEPRALVRTRRGSAQAGLGLDERIVNVAGAFAAGQPELLEDKRILLVDDIITTGTTAAACAQALLDAGAQSVFAVALASAEQEKSIPDGTEEKSEKNPVETP